MASFGENLKAIRKNRGYSQEKFAEILHSNQAVLSSWERGFRMPPIATVKSIADILHVPLSSLLSIQDSGEDDDLVREVAEMLKQNPKVRSLFEKIKYMTDDDLDALLVVVNAISKESVMRE